MKRREVKPRRKKTNEYQPECGLAAAHGSGAVLRSSAGIYDLGGLKRGRCFLLPPTKKKGIILDQRILACFDRRLFFDLPPRLSCPRRDQLRHLVVR